MKHFKQVFLGFALASFMFVSAGAVAQTALPPGGILGGAAISNADTFAGDTLVADTGLVAFASTPGGAFSGFGRTRVLADNDNTGGFGAGKLEFVYQLFNAGPDLIDQWTLGLFSGVQTKAAFNTLLGGTPAFTITRALGVGHKIDVDFLGGFAADLIGGTNLVVYTDSDVYAPSTAFVQNFGQASYAIYAPVPEPEIYAMLAAGLGFMGFVARRRKQQLAA